MLKDNHARNGVGTLIVARWENEFDATKARPVKGDGTPSRSIELVGGVSEAAKMLKIVLGLDRLPVFGFEQPLRHDRGHAAGAGGCDRLTEYAVLHVPAGENARDIGANGVMSYKVTIGIHI